MIPYRNACEDPNIKEALQQRAVHLVMLMCCPKCVNYSYWNEGSHFSCSVDDCGYSVSGKRLEKLLEDDQSITLADYMDMQLEEGDLP